MKVNLKHKLIPIWQVRIYLTLEDGVRTYRARNISTKFQMKLSSRKGRNHYSASGLCRNRENLGETKFPTVMMKSIHLCILKAKGKQ